MSKKNTGAGKGDANRSIPRKFWDGYDDIKWPSKKKLAKKPKKS